MTRRLFLITLAAVCGLTAEAQERRTLDVLVVGNSYTYVNNLGDVLAGVAASLPSGPRIAPTLIVGGGMTLQWHLAAGKATAAVDSKRWDYVVLQEQSALGGGSEDGQARLSPPTIFHESVRRFVPRIRTARSTPLLLMTWARLARPDEQATLTGAYRAIGKELAVQVAPAGLAWQEALRRWPGLSLHVEDGSHPNPAGTYLTACVLYAAITGNNPRGAAATITGHPYARREGTVDASQVVTLVSLPPELAARLQTVAWDIAAADLPR